MTEAKKEINHEIADWVGDIVALESHVEEAMDAQLKIKADDSLNATFRHFHDTVRESKQRAVNFQKDYGSEAGNPIIKTGANLLGKAAGVIDKVRNDSVSKSIRDDYTAYNHTAVAYTMLHTTAMAFKDQAAADFAEKGMRTYAKLVQEVNHVLPEAVIFDLKHGDHAPVIDPNVVRDCRAVIDSVWKETN